MKSLSWIFCLILFANSSFGQKSIEIDELLNKKQILKEKLVEISDSIEIVDRKISEIRSILIKNQIKDSLITVTVRSGAKIRARAFPFANVVKHLSNDEDVIVVEYDDNYYKVCFKSDCGYISTVWLKSQSETDENTETIKPLNLTNEAQEKKSSSQTYGTRNKSRHKSSRMYIRGPRGGCYYINSKGNKSYVSRNLCGG